MTTFPSWFWPVICVWLIAVGSAFAAFALRPPRAKHRPATPPSVPAAPEEGTHS